jgi:plasmid stabilization system protein ParE
MRLEFHPAVQRDFNDAISYYESAGGPRLADRFEAEFHASIAAVKTAPRQFSFYQQSSVLRPIRLQSFPYVIVYREIPHAVRVTLLRHEKRHPRFAIARW